MWSSWRPPHLSRLEAEHEYRRDLGEVVGVLDHLKCCGKYMKFVMEELGARCLGFG